MVNTVTSPYTVSYSLTQEAAAGTGNLTGNPQFADTADGNLTLLSCSPALNSGSTAALPAGTTLDISGRQRVFGAAVDMGSHERQTASGQSFIFVDGTATGNADGTGWPHAFTSMLPALNEMNNCNTAVTLSMAAGTYIIKASMINYSPGYSAPVTLTGDQDNMTVPSITSYHHAGRFCFCICLYVKAGA